MATRLSARSLIGLAALVVVMVGGMIRLGDPEPALPRCNPAATYQLRCRP